MQKQRFVNWISWKLLLYIISLLCFGLTLTACSTKPREIVLHTPKLASSLPTIYSDIETEIISAFTSAIEGREDVLAFLIYDVNVDHIDLAEDNDLALIWISLSDPNNGTIIPTETGLAIAQRYPEDNHIISAFNDHNWKITLQADADWETVLSSIPTALLTEETKSLYVNSAQSIPHAQKTYTGYHLPWAPGEAKYLTGSVGHVYLYKTCPDTCLYAFDFADGGMWPVLAAKGGTVKYAVWNYPNGNTKHANYIVLEDSTTNPTTFQVYTHLAQDSIPVALRTPGAEVVQGQKIGVVDDTGVSTGHHLHFHVHTNPGSLWGTSVDITFEEVDINGGRPRTCNEANLFPALGKQCQSGDLFVSENNDRDKPTGDITSPTDGSQISDSNLNVKAWAKDDSGIASVQIMVNYSGDWLILKPIFSTPNMDTTIDLCALGIPDGDLFIALKIADSAGRQAEGLPGLKRITKRFACPLPPPKCTITENQIGLFELPDFQGECQVFNIGSLEALTFTNGNLSSLGSILVGENVYITKEDGTIPTLITSTIPDLSDQGLDIKTLSGLIIELKPPKPTPPLIEIYGTELDNFVGAVDSVGFKWEVLDSSFEYRGKLAQNDSLVSSFDWQKIDHWEFPSLSPGSYKLYLDVRNMMGDSFSVIEFKVLEHNPVPQTSLVSLPDRMGSTVFKLKWDITEGVETLWQTEIQFRENGGNWQPMNQGFPAQVKETWFIGQQGSIYEFEIRGIDLSGNKEEFHSAQTNSEITIEDRCQPDEYDISATGDNSMEHAGTLELDDPQHHNICTLGDTDWMAFPAEKGSIYRISVIPTGESTSIRIKLYAVSISENKLLTEAVPDNFGKTTSTVWAAPNDGIFVLEASAADPRLTGTDVSYTIEINKVVQVHTPSIILSTLILPLLWGLAQVFKKLSSAFRK